MFWSQPQGETTKRIGFVYKKFIFLNKTLEIGKHIVSLWSFINIYLIFWKFIGICFWKHRTFWQLMFAPQIAVGYIQDVPFTGKDLLWYWMFRGRPCWEPSCWLTKPDFLCYGILHMWWYDRATPQEMWWFISENYYWLKHVMIK